MDERKTLLDLMNENITEPDNEQIIELPLSKVKPNPYQPRKEFDKDALNDLASSIKVHGVIQPIIVKENAGEYIIIAGERRYRASLLAKKETIPAIVRSYEKSKMIELALIENLQRQELSAYEEANAYALMIRELGYNQTDVAKHVGKSRSYVTNMLGILNLPKEVLSMLQLGKISFGHARALSKLSDEKRIIELAHIIIMKSLSVRQIEELVKNEDKKVAHHARKSDKQIISKSIGKDNLKIKIAISKDKISIKAKSHDELQEIVKWLLEVK
ncbi:MAG: ParB/RepB/Spo0J family partition protein [Acholeplasmatales bacterium]|nr:ParB/RepB/Spo0J family partition protein [Acholeplasmatales bacterium]